MIDNEYKNIEDKVLAVYRRVSPSYRELTSEEDFKKNILQRKAILNQLKLVPNYFKNKKVIEVGGGTGENSIFYALWGADVTILEPNEISCARAVELFKQFDKKIEIINASLFEIDSKLFSNFDIIISEGVLHHTFNTLKALSLILENMSDDSLIMIAIPEYHAWFKRQLQREVINVTSSNENEIIENSKKYFQNHINRAMKYGLRSEETVIYDTYVNPQIRRELLKDICDTFYTHNIYHVSSYPSLETFFETQPWSKIKENRFNYNYFENYYKLLEKIWMSSGEENFEEELNDIQKLLARVEMEHKELIELEEKIKNRLFTFNDLQAIQNGYMGIGMSYFVGVKDQNLI